MTLPCNGSKVLGLQGRWGTTGLGPIRHVSTVQRTAGAYHHTARQYRAPHSKRVAPHSVARYCMSVPRSA
eukprot:2402393-Rhodomonas_salina.4